jgi:MFS family permease
MMHTRRRADAVQRVAEAFTVTTFVSLIASFASGVAVDRLERPELLYACAMVCGAAASVTLIRMDTRGEVYLFGIAYGMFTGFINTGSMVVPAALFGRAHLGAINGVVTGAAQLCGGGGPLAYSVVQRVSGSYSPIFTFFFFGMSAAAGLLLLPHPRPDLSTTPADSDTAASAREDAQVNRLSSSDRLPMSQLRAKAPEAVALLAMEESSV